ncbi:tRNA (adenosine(37)-N6)-dimethylallyltransferase MiaA [Salinibacterium sp. UTAS2018]|uniref:tRNA (adenosine(37)-N6)-dimethylallyltransferase MiaA n=1 Tax=Salinibacterium sp. UTAS2018 TaxID=2508880 RepID=UPI00100954EA|nr:tRNA (adenosine(37)-N6)-dimethylallyltransferase MiaA [Salinibacterium sp. UTAS2018]QAV68994.1 tRNA (adenosine(37)-N6)-dimethylallyltransferase MiaA [Salinibacterium sp. UTAS2018]
MGIGSTPSLVVVVGATGTGKSELSLDIAEAVMSRGVPAEIINADAMQLYRGMNIGTAKLPLEDRRGVPHHMLDVLDPTDDASVAQYQVDARQLVTQIQSAGRVPIMVGGSGLYVSSVIHDFQFPARDAEVRARLEAELERDGIGLLFQKLQAVDPAAAQSIGASNGRRIVRALEVIEITGEPFGAGLPEETKLWTPAHIFGLIAPRDELVQRLNRRVQQMWDAGLLDEVRGLRDKGLGVTAARAIGYAQAIEQLDGGLSEAEAIEQTAALTRRYARRQVGWFKRYEQSHWLAYDDPDRAARALTIVMRENGSHGDA